MTVTYLSPNPVEPAGVIDEHAASLSEDRIIRRVPGHPQPCGDPGHNEVVDHDPFQRPPHPATRQLRPLRRRSGEVLAPGAPAPKTLVSMDTDQQHGRAVPERLIRELSRVRPARERPAAAAPAPRIWFSDPALDHRPIRGQPLADGHEAKLVEAAEHSQVRGHEGSVEHVEVFQPMISVRTSITGRPRPSSRHRRAQPATRSSAKSPITKQGAKDAVGLANGALFSIENSLRIDIAFQKQRRTKRNKISKENLMFARKLLVTTAAVLALLAPSTTPAAAQTPDSFKTAQTATPSDFCGYFLYLFCR